MSSVLLHFIAALAVLATDPPPRAGSAAAELARAEQLLAQMKYAEASKALQDAFATPGNDRATLIKILERQAVVSALLNRPDRAQVLFRALISVDPEHHLPEEYAPRVMTPFYEAKGWISAHPPVRIEARPAVTKGGKVERVAVAVTADPQQLGRKIRFHLRAGGGSWRSAEAPIIFNAAHVAAGAEASELEWCAELLNEYDGVLAQAGSKAAPLIERGSPRPPEASFAAAPKATPPAAIAPPEKKPLMAEVAVARFRPAAYVALGAGAAAIGGGVAFGVLAQSARGRVENAARDEQGRVVGVTQREAFALRDQARTDAVVANVLFAVGAAAVVAGGGLFWYGRPVSVHPAPGGVAVGGTLP